MSIKFKIRCSAIGQITGSTIGLTESQTQKMHELELREAGNHPKGLGLTDNMRADLAELRHRHNNPELTQGMKTYCEKWLKEHLYGRREQIKSLSIDKGHATEEDGFTLMCLHLNLGMVYKNEERKDNGLIHGECDLDHNGVIYDNKSSLTLKTFPMFEDKCPNPDYIAQMQGYMELWDRDTAKVVYTLNDLPENLIYDLINKPWLSDEDRAAIAEQHIFTLGYWQVIKNKYFPNDTSVKFTPVPDHLRIKVFEVKRDREFIKDLYRRIDMCDKYVNELWQRIQKN